MHQSNPDIEALRGQTFELVTYTTRSKTSYLEVPNTLLRALELKDVISKRSRITVSYCYLDWAVDKPRFEIAANTYGIAVCEADIEGFSTPPVWALPTYHPYWLVNGLSQGDAVVDTAGHVKEVAHLDEYSVVLTPSTRPEIETEHQGERLELTPQTVFSHLNVHDTALLRNRLQRLELIKAVDGPNPGPEWFTF